MHVLHNIKARLYAGALIAILLAAMIGTTSVQAARTCTIRYYLSPMVGSGTAEDPLRPLAIDLPSYPHHTFATAWTYLYNDQSWFKYALVVVASTNHKPLIRNSELGAFPDVPLDTDYGDMSSEDIATFTDIYTRFGIDPQEMMDESTHFRGSLRYISRWITTWDTTIPTLVSCPTK